MNALPVLPHPPAPADNLVAPVSAPAGEGELSSFESFLGSGGGGGENGEAAPEETFLAVLSLPSPLAELTENAEGELLAEGMAEEESEGEVTVDSVSALLCLPALPPPPPPPLTASPLLTLPTPSEAVAPSAVVPEEKALAGSAGKSAGQNLAGALPERSVVPAVEEPTQLPPQAAQRQAAPAAVAPEAPSATGKHPVPPEPSNLVPVDAPPKRDETMPPVSDLRASQRFAGATGGMEDAKHSPTMGVLLAKRPAEGQAANFAGSDRSPVPFAAEASAALNRGRTQAAPENLQPFSFDHPPAGSMSANHAAVLPSAVELANPGTVERAVSQPSEISRVATATLEAAERLRATGGGRVEVQVQLEDGQSLTLRLQVTENQVQPHFVTESESLRQALEQGWSRFTHRAAERGLQIAAPVFESGQSQSGMDFNQPRDGRDSRGDRQAPQNREEASPAAAWPFPPRRASGDSRQPPSRVAAAAANAERVQLYA